MSTAPIVHTERIITASNLLSLSRVVLLVPIVYYLLLGSIDPDHYRTALWLMLVAGLTDTFDGMLARRLNQVTRLGVILDPLADKVCTAVIMGTLVLSRPDFPVWFFILAMARDLVIFCVGLYVRNKYGHIFMSNMLGKVTMTVMAIAVILFAIRNLWSLNWLYQLSLWLSVLLLLASSVVYAVRLIRFMSTQADRQ